MTAQEKALEIFGNEAQIDKMLSEMHELQGRLHQAKFDMRSYGEVDSTTRNEILDEYVDVVKITLPQLIPMLGFTRDEINKKIVEKQTKLENCLRGEHA